MELYSLISGVSQEIRQTIANHLDHLKTVASEAEKIPLLLVLDAERLNSLNRS